LEPVILHQIPFQVDTESLKKKLRIKEESPYLTDFMRLVDEAEKIGRPKALYKMSFIDNKGEDFVIVDGVRLRSRVLRVNLELAQRIFPYVVTCGMELEEWSNRIEDVLKRFWADAIREMVMRYAHTLMEGHLTDHLRPGKLSRMSPGSLVDWPIQEQRPLFEILGNTRDTIGVHLTDSLLMIPTKSVSGIRFPTEESFESCQLCPREECPNRRAPYDPDLYEKKFSKRIE
jgi:Vitamin B12 dependent methionine synthase, activation domain